MNISQYLLAKDIINEIGEGVRAIAPDTALRLSRYFGLSERFWINMQTRYELEIEKDRLLDRLDKELHIYRVAA
jgi:addiction module HigA family antidote